MRVAIHQPNFLPWLGYFYKMSKCDAFVFLDDASFSKGSYTNRVMIKTAKGTEWLTIPVLTKGKSGQMINEVEINPVTNWREKIWKTLQHNYKNCPFWCLHEAGIREIFESVEIDDRLSTLNARLIWFVMEALSLDCLIPIFWSSQLQATGTGTDRLIHICQELHADSYLSGQGGAGYQDREKFKEAGIHLHYSDFKHPVYPQQFGEFVPGLSIMDLLANCGNKSKEILEWCQSE